MNELIKKLDNLVEPLIDLSTDFDEWDRNMINKAYMILEIPDLSKSWEVN
jgi:hypothetical protein